MSSILSILSAHFQCLTDFVQVSLARRRRRRPSRRAGPRRTWPPRRHRWCHRSLRSRRGRSRVRSRAQRWTARMPRARRAARPTWARVRCSPRCSARSIAWPTAPAALIQAPLRQLPRMTPTGNSEPLNAIFIHSYYDAFPRLISPCVHICSTNLICYLHILYTYCIYCTL